MTRPVKYPLGIQDFESLRNDGYAYVDKTALIYDLVHSGRYYFLSRPRRFGKSLLLSTIACYLSGRNELFKDLAIGSLEKSWTCYPVFHLDLNVGEYSSEASLLDKLNAFLTPLERKLGIMPMSKEMGQRFEQVIATAYAQLKQRIVILVDEYDKPLLQAIGNQPLQDRFRNILKSFYGVMKSCDKYIKLGFLTGVTKFGKVSVFSDLNNITDISMDARYQTLCGLTKQEITMHFQPGLQRLATAYGISTQAAIDKLRENYDGYHFRQNGADIYNPYSVLNALAKSEIGSYWFSTGTPTFLVKLLQHDDFPLPELTEGEVSSDVLESVDSTDQNPLPIIYQSGYLTIKGYDTDFGTYRLGFPNKEVEQGFIRFIIPYYTSVQASKSSSIASKMVRDLRCGNPEDFMRSMEAMMASASYYVAPSSEAQFQNAFFIITHMLGLYVEVERNVSNGRIDMTIQTPSFVYIIEFKIDQSSSIALQQIHDKQYARPWLADARQLFLIGVNFSSKKRGIDGWKIHTNAPHDQSQH